MSGNFINTTFNDALDFVTDTAKDIIRNNPMYVYNDKKAFKTTYFHINAEQSTLDEAAKIAYADIGPDCPFRFNQINNMILYGGDKIQLALENGEVGLESSDIDGEAMVLPNTIVPYPGDYFEISHIDDSKWLFKVNQVSKDTLDNGSNMYQIQYRLEHTDDLNILPLVVEEYEMMINNVNTEFTPIIRSSAYSMVDKLDQMDIRLKKFYKELFYDTKVQSFVYRYIYDSSIYDATMIEFLRRNKILSLSGQTDYVYVDHKLPLSRTFSIDYEHSFLYAVESRDLELLQRSNFFGVPEQINNKMCIFNKRPENYFSISYYTPDQNVPAPYVPLFNPDVIEHILSHSLYEPGDYAIYNTIIKFFWKEDLNDADLEAIEHIDYKDNIELFYTIPILIYCLECTIKSLMRATYR